MAETWTGRISVLVPVLNEERNLARFLTNLRTIGVDEIVVADGASCDASLAIATDLADVAVTSAKGRGRQINAAAQVASGDAFWILHCDCTPPLNAIGEIRSVLNKPGVRLGAFPIAFGDPHLGLRAFGVFSRFDSVFTTFGDQGFFCRAHDFWEVSGAPNITMFEDVELRRRFKTIGKVAKARSVMHTSPRRFRKNGVFRQQWRNTHLLLSYLSGSCPETLAKNYRTMKQRNG